MALHPRFPTDPYAILPPEIRWIPGDDVDPLERGKLLPPLVERVRQEVWKWRCESTEGAKKRPLKE